MHVPQRGHGDGGEAGAEADGIVATVEHDTGGELLAEAVGEQFESGEVGSADDRGGLHLDTDDPTIGRLKDGVHLGPAPIAEVEELGVRVGVRDLFAKLHRHEGLEERTHR